MAKIVKASDLKTARRGRKAERIASVLEAMKSLGTGDALVLDEFGAVDESEKSRVYQSVRAHWGDVREDACRVSFDPESGMVCVTAKPAKATKGRK